MRDNEAIKCPICGKELGRYILDSISYCKGIGSIPCYTMKLDYRKASHHYNNTKGQRGHICKACARKLFPEGKRYQVMVMNVHKPMAIYGGEYGDVYATRQRAEDKAREMTAEHGYRYWVEEREL